MRYYPKNAVGFKIDEEVAEVLGPAVSELFETWDGYVYDEELFEAIQEEHGVIPMRVGVLNESRGGEVQGGHFVQRAVLLALAARRAHRVGDICGGHCLSPHLSVFVALDGNPPIRSRSRRKRRLNYKPVQPVTASG